MHSKKLLAALALASAGAAQAVTVLSEGFEDLSTLAGAGWVTTNVSDTPTQPWFQGNTGIFSAFAGSASSYAAASFLSSGLETGKVSNWLITPTLNLTGGGTLTFYARTGDAGYLDALTVRLSPTGSATTTDFTTTLQTVSTLNLGWTLYTVTLPSVSSARIAFEYNVANALNADYVGIDSVAVNTAAVPEPTTALMLGLGLAGVLVRRRLTA